MDAIIWVFIGIVLFAGFMLIKFEHQMKRVKLIAILLILILLYFSISGVIRSSGNNLTSVGGVLDTVYLYFGWMGNAFSDLWQVGKNTVSMTGKAIDLGDNNSTTDGRV